MGIKPHVKESGTVSVENDKLICARLSY